MMLPSIGSESSTSIAIGFHSGLHEIGPIALGARGRKDLVIVHLVDLVGSVIDVGVEVRDHWVAQSHLAGQFRQAVMVGEVRHVHSLQHVWEEIWAQHPAQDLERQRPPVRWVYGPLLNVEDQTILLMKEYFARKEEQKEPKA